MHEIAVVAVARVDVIHSGEAKPLVLGAEIFIVPICHHDLTVGIDAGEKDEDNVVKDLACPLMLACDKLVCKNGRELRARGLA